MCPHTPSGSESAKRHKWQNYIKRPNQIRANPEIELIIEQRSEKSNSDSTLIELGLAT